MQTFKEKIYIAITSKDEGGGLKNQKAFATEVYKYQKILKQKIKELKHKVESMEVMKFNIK